MGRYDLRSQQIYDTATNLLNAKRLAHPPSWYKVVANVPPSTSQLLVRPPFHRKTKKTKASKLFQPVVINYPEDKLRQKFFSDHPWELARPKVILENDGKDYQRQKWDNILQRSKKLDGERYVYDMIKLSIPSLRKSSVVQRQVYLMEKQKMSRKDAYDQARRELYKHRRREDVERRVAREEAQLTGASFGLGPIDIGMHLENTAFEDWKLWAQNESTKSRQDTAAMYTDLDAGEASSEFENNAADSALEEIDTDITGSRKG